MTLDATPAVPCHQPDHSTTALPCHQPDHATTALLCHQPDPVFPDHHEAPGDHPFDRCQHATDCVQVDAPCVCVEDPPSHGSLNIVPSCEPPTEGCHVAPALPAGDPASCEPPDDDRCDVPALPAGAAKLTMPDDSLSEPLTATASPELCDPLAGCHHHSNASDSFKAASSHVAWADRVDDHSPRCPSVEADPSCFEPVPAIDKEAEPLERRETSNR